MSGQRERQIARDRARGKRWDEAKEAVNRLDWDQQRMLIRKMVADQWMRLMPQSPMQELLKERLVDKMQKLMDGLMHDLVEIEAAVDNNHIKEWLPHLRASKSAWPRRGAWASKAINILRQIPDHKAFAEEGHRIWTGFDAAGGWKVPDMGWPVAQDSDQQKS